MRCLGRGLGRRFTLGARVALSVGAPLASAGAPYGATTKVKLCVTTVLVFPLP